MLLAIDVGNTNVTFAAFEGRELKAEWRLSTAPSRTGEEYAAWLAQVMAFDGIAFSDIDCAIIATVVPQALFNLRGLCKRYFRCEPVVIGEPGVDLGMKVMIDSPGDAGADRLVDAVGAHVTYGGPLVVIDFGTGTTFDVTDGDGNYRGGVIAPGINLSLEAMHTKTAKLPRISVERPPQVIGRDTLSSMQSGIYWGYISLIEGIVERIGDEFGEPLKTIATGGLAPLFAKATDAIQHVDADITMKGLVEIFERNK
jgi:type III pantothenate kinase